MNIDYVKMCKTASQIQQLKYKKQEFGYDMYLFKTGDRLENYSKIETLDHDWLYRVSVRPGMDEKKVFWIPTFDQLLDIYSKENGSTSNESLTILWFANFIEDLVKENHGFGLVFPTKEMLALVFIMEKVFGIKNNWSRDLEYKLVGGWIY